MLHTKNTNSFSIFHRANLLLSALLLICVYKIANAEDLISFDDLNVAPAVTASPSNIDDGFNPLQPSASAIKTELKPESIKVRNVDFWRLMLEGFAVPPLSTPAVSSLTKLYAANPRFLSRSMQRSSPYIHEIIDMLKLRGMPTDLALLPVIESGFDPLALSPAEAAGIWQFIPETGRRYGLKQDWLRDERRDPLAATRAALNYLQTLYNMFGDWHLALASYNCGENCVTRAIGQAKAAGKGRDFASIAPYLPEETRNYVPRFIAVRNVFRNLESNGVQLPAIHHNPRITSIYLNQAVDLNAISNLAGINRQELALLNAGVLRQVVPPNYGVIWLPEDALGKLKKTLSDASGKVDSDALVSLSAAKAIPGENLGSFAKRNSTTVEEVRYLNNIHRSLYTISSGTLFIPRKPGEAPFSDNPAMLSPLKMTGEQALTVRFKANKKPGALLTAHRLINTNSGWIPGRLQLSSRGKRRY